MQFYLQLQAFYITDALSILPIISVLSSVTHSTWISFWSKNFPYTPSFILAWNPSRVCPLREAFPQKAFGLEQVWQGYIKSIYAIKRTCGSYPQTTIYTLMCWSPCLDPHREPFLWVSLWFPLRLQGNEGNVPPQEVRSNIFSPISWKEERVGGRATCQPWPG